MTPALKAMVEAMAAAATDGFESRPNSVDLLEDGRTLLVCADNYTLALDLEHVARAGLAAIPIEVLAAAIYSGDPQTVPGDPYEPFEPLNGRHVLPFEECDLDYREAALDGAKAMIAAILGDAP